MNLNLKKELIPKGMYCDGCPYWGRMVLYDEIGKIEFPYCIYIQIGSIPNNGWKNNEFERLQKLLNLTDDELWFGMDEKSERQDALLEADLLWDGCKECGINNDYDDADLA